MANNKIELTQQELEDLKDTVKFRTMVVLEIKRLSGIPDTVNSLKTQSAFQWAFIVILIGSIITAAIKVLAG